LAVKPYVLKTCGVITTGSEIKNGLIKDTFTPVIEEKLAPFGVKVVAHAVPGDDAALITAAIHDMIQAGVDMVICTGGMSVDPDDRTPGAIRNSGAEIIGYGSPTLPGAMFLQAYIGETPVLGLPGCVMYAHRTVFDLMLPRLMAGERITAADMAALGEGGLCLDCPACVFPNCSFAAAASRMG
jgi:molybdenum cofactor synthesis domain-containing protein